MPTSPFNIAHRSRWWVCRSDSYNRKNRLSQPAGGVVIFINPKMLQCSIPHLILNVTDDDPIKRPKQTCFPEELRSSKLFSLQRSCGPQCQVYCVSHTHTHTPVSFSGWTHWHFSHCFVFPVTSDAWHNATGVNNVRGFSRHAPAATCIHRLIVTEALLLSAFTSEGWRIVKSAVLRVNHTMNSMKQVVFSSSGLCLRGRIAVVN